jgi:hypothetical protein
MKQLLFLILFLLPYLALAQYPSNGNQKITLGEQTSADGLVYRGVLADTGIITPSSDTSAYIILDTVNHRFYNYNRATNVWSVATIGSISSGLTGVLPVANGGTGASSFSPNNYLIRTNLSGIFDTSAIYEVDGNVGIGTTTTNSKLTLNSSNIPVVISSNGTFTNNTSVLNTVHGTMSSLYTFSGTFGYGNLRNISSTGIITSTASGQTNLRNGYFSARTSGMGTAVLLSSFTGEIILEGTGNTTNAIGAEYAILKTGNNTTTNAYGLKFNNLTNSDGTITNTFAIHTGDITSGNQTNKAYNIFLSDENARNYIGGNVGFGVLDATAVLHLKAGTATASTAPLKFTSGTNLTTAEAGAMEFNGTNLFFSPSTTRHTVNHGLTGSATLNFSSTLTLLSADLTITVTGAADGDVVSLGVPNAAVNANTSYSAWVSAANTVTVRFNNYSAGTVDPASALFKVFVTK